MNYMHVGTLVFPSSELIKHFMKIVHELISGSTVFSSVPDCRSVLAAVISEATVYACADIPRAGMKFSIATHPFMYIFLSFFTIVHPSSPLYAY